MIRPQRPPACYLPRAHFSPGSLAPGRLRGSFCEWKGRAADFTLIGGDRFEADAGWTYADPDPAHAPIRNHIALYRGQMDACTVEGETVTPQPGGFYSGWITSDLIGPFKGGAGTDWW